MNSSATRKSARRVLLGDTAKDTISGVTGTVVCICERIHEPRVLTLQLVDDSTKLPSEAHFTEGRLVYVKT